MITERGRIESTKSSLEITLATLSGTGRLCEFRIEHTSDNIPNKANIMTSTFPLTLLGSIKTGFGMGLILAPAWTTNMVYYSNLEPASTNLAVSTHNFP